MDLILSEYLALCPCVLGCLLLLHDVRLLQHLRENKNPTPPGK